ncbi:hypothetical protein SDRG_05202 [Saprolegnia diclina VS20]|uniref:Uncharacterized protein n=1 Tax=Saprolegnia diclina (strain VS20) TaxID=1156394 RepID=T0RYF5_SAPDV|nr:hypothetical protein SDRG_05202 [Saprolegnia diclina VS20]EQC37608.1 hypothetical protein SDRG_05202 [Saprolegnia diclina VS20]|eukprot:XP_008609128.1 hypothetical protein SDRG_05202 [Saprolegnia diclina VS20]
MPHTPPMRVAKAGRTQRVTFAGVLLCMIAVSTTVFCVHHQFTATPRHDVSLRHPDCSYVTSAFAEQYEAMAQRPPSAPLQALRRSAASDPMAQRSWADCLPMRTVVCGVAAGSQDTLFTQSPPCRSAVVHHLLVATMAAIEAQGHVAVPIGPALQHLLEYFTLPPDGTSIDVLTDAAIGNLASWFWVRGFAHFEDNATGASVTCLAPHHTLATILFGDDAPDATPPHLRWSTMQAFDDRIVLASEKSHPYRRVEMAPLGCLPLYDVSIAVPSHPTAFVKTPRSMRQHDVDIPGPSSRCKALCDDSTPRVQTHSVLNASRCSARHDTEFSARLATYTRHPQRLHLTEDHAPSLTVLTDHVSDGKVWQYCLPMLPQQCGARRGTKTTLFETPPGKPCRSAVLQLLLESILELTHELDLPSFVYFGTLLGAWRDEAIIPHTPDVDVALPSETDWTALQDAMWARGVYVFKRDIHSACIAPHHPLAALLYSPTASATS